MFNRHEEQETSRNNLPLLDKIRRKYDLTPVTTLILGLIALFFSRFPHLSSPICFQRSILDK